MTPTPSSLLRARLPVTARGSLTPPPQISSPVLDKLVTHRPLIKRAVIMFQAEFAERLTAKYGAAVCGRRCDAALA